MLPVGHAVGLREKTQNWTPCSIKISCRVWPKFCHVAGEWGCGQHEAIAGGLMLVWPRIFIDNFRNFSDKAKAEVMPFAARLRKGQQQQRWRTIVAGRACA